MPTFRIGPADVLALTRQQALGWLLATITGGQHVKLAFANAHFVNLAHAVAAFRAVLPQFAILPDGAGVDLAARILYGQRFPANLNGTDFTPELLLAAERPLRVVLLGARPGVAERAAQKLATLAPQHAYEVLSDGFFDAAREAALLAALEARPADVLLVAMGNPVQEKWIARAITERHARLAMGVGALFDFLGGEVQRAPALIRQWRLEWVWRLAQEPKRLWRRYIMGNPLFVARVLLQKAKR